LYGCIAGLGLTFVSDLLIGQKLWLQLLGGAFLIYLGIRTLLSRPVGQATFVKSADLVGAYGSTFLLTLTNPMTILFFVGVMAGLGVGSAGSDYAHAAVLVLGVFVGSALWWAMLTGIAELFRAAISHSGLRWVNRVSATVILLCGIVVLISAAAPDSSIAEFLDVPFG